jgi:phosphoribosylglycinamide formyltransferase-1
MPDRFIDEPITPVKESIDVSFMASGGPGLPRAFLWRGRTVEVVAVLRFWHDTGQCDRGSEEIYVRKHWFEVETAEDGTMKIYFERQPRRGKKGPRWWLFSIREPGKGTAGA